jgi:tol-pal system protein YbgF
MVAWALASGIFLSAIGGCGTATPGPATANVVDLERNVIDLRAQNAGYARQLEELQNQLFVVEGRLESDSRCVAGQAKAPPAPVVKRIVVPAEVAPAAPQPAPAPATAVADEAGSVEYAEAAAPRRRARPVLRLSGSGNTGTITYPDRRGEEASEAPAPALASAPKKRPFRRTALTLYHDSLMALREGRHAEALAGFHRFLTRYEPNRYSDNAQYWLGECYYDLKQYQSAAREFRRVSERYPDGNKVPGALLKLGYSELAAGNRREGRRALEKVRHLYPKHATAVLAEARLTALHQESDGDAAAASALPLASSDRSPRSPEGL